MAALFQVPATLTPLPWTLTIMALLGGVSPPSSANTQPKRILVLHSYHQGYLWTDQIMDGFAESLARSHPKAEIYIEYMNTKRLPPEKVFPLLEKMYDLFYRNVKFDVIMASDNNALDFLLLHRDNLFPGVPVVFCGINNMENYKRDRMPDYTGVSEALDIESTIMIAKKLFPDTRTIAVINDVTETGEINRTHVERLARQMKQFEFLFLHGLKADVLQEKLKGLGSDTIILALAFFRDPDGRTFSARESMDFIVSASTRPVFTAWDFYMAPGVAGGKLLSGRIQGENAAALADRILRGEKADSMPIVESPTAYIFDYEGLKKFSISEDRLPAGSLVIGRPDTFYSRYAHYLWFGGFLFIVQLCIISLLYRNIILRRREEASRQALEVKYRDIFENSVEGIFQTTPDGKLLSANSALAKMFGYLSAVEITGESYDIGEQAYAVPAERLALIGQILENGFVAGVETRLRRRDGSLFWGSISARAVRGHDGSTSYLEGFVTDITVQKKSEEEKAHLEEQLLQSQKMEAIGRLTGGIAHDFNNILTALVGYASLLQVRLEPDSHLRHYVDEILASSERATSLTQSLLTFSRKQPIATRRLALNRIVSDFEGFLKRLIGEDIELTADLGEKDLVIMASPGQIEQVLMNLATNARDAMPDGGTLSIELREVALHEPVVGNSEIIQPGRYALLTVSDCGIGMDQETKERVFEPFFTSKGPGKGTGLGLSIAYAVIRQHGGHINVYSEAGHGTTFRIYLPLSGGQEDSEPVAPLPAPPIGCETILVAEDDDAVRTLVSGVLESSGYAVLQASDGAEAVRAYQQYGRPIDLLLFDVVMPKKNGREAYELIRQHTPDAKVLFMSGYTTDLVSSKGILEDGRDFVQKPVSPRELLTRVRAILDSSSV